jgi:serine/threonine protein kinase
MAPATDHTTHTTAAAAGTTPSLPLPAPEPPRYGIIHRLASGAFGAVFLGVDHASGARVAVKQQTNFTSTPSLSREFDVYTALHAAGVPGIPTTHCFQSVEWDAAGCCVRHPSGGCAAAAAAAPPPPMHRAFGLSGAIDSHDDIDGDGGSKGASARTPRRRQPRCEVMVMALLGADLHQEVCARGRMSAARVLVVAVATLRILQGVHGAGYIHRDIKPENLMRPVDGDALLYLVDFGLCKSFLRTGPPQHDTAGAAASARARGGGDALQHAHMRDQRSLVGTPLFASLNVHAGLEPSRRDDMQSLAYTLMFLLLGSLPWRRGSDSSRRDAHAHACATATTTATMWYPHMAHAKMTTDFKAEFRAVGAPPVFEQFMVYSTQLGFTHPPDYNAWISRFARTYDDMA